MSAAWTDKTVLVTGAEGFIGSHLTERLVQEGARVRAFVHYSPFHRWGWLDSLDAELLERIEVFSGDVRDPHRVMAAVEGQEYVFHLSSLIGIPYSYESPDSYVQVNVVGALNVLNACRKEGVRRLIHTSTSEVYGTARYVPIDEDHPLQPQSPYAASKIGADMLALSYHHSFGVPVAIIRPFNTYGPRQSARAVIPTIISQLYAGADEIKLGSLTPTRDFNYVLDTVAGFLGVALCERAVGEVINIGSGRETSVGDLAEMLMGITGRKVEIVSETERVRPEGSEVDRLVCNATRARQWAEWEPAHTLEEGLQETSRWVRDHLDVFKPGKYAL